MNKTHTVSIILAMVFLSKINTSALAQEEWVAQTVLIQNVAVASREPGIVTAVLVKVGQVVKANEQLVRLDRDFNERETAIATLERTIATIEAENNTEYQFAKKSVEVSEKILQRSRLANEQFAGSITPTEIEQLGLEFEKAILSQQVAELTNKISRSKLDLKSEQEALAKLRLNYREVLAPCSGIVVEVRKQVGESLAASESIVRIVSLDQLRIVSKIPQGMLGSVKVGDTVSFVPIREAISGLTIAAKVTFVSPEINAEEGVVEIWAEFDNRNVKIFSGEAGRISLKAR